MPLDMLNSAAVSEAVRLLCQSKLKLAENCAASATVKVGSTELFRSTQGGPVYPITGLAVAAVLDDSASCPEPVTVSAIVDLETLTLHAACAGTFTTANDATIRLATPRVTLGASANVTDGWFEFPEEIAAAKLPAIAVLREPTIFVPATLRHELHIYPFRILYARQKGVDEESPRVLEQAIEALYDLLSEDLYLGGTVDERRLTGCDLRPPEDMAYQPQGVDVAELRLEGRKFVAWEK